jgi:antitoxin HicB
MDEKYIGSSFDSFLDEENIREEVEAEAVKKIIAYALLEKLQTEHLTKRDLARKMGTSRAALDRLLDPNNTSVTLKSMVKAAHVAGKRLRLEIV